MRKTHEPGVDYTWRSTEEALSVNLAAQQNRHARAAMPSRCTRRM
jgi:hypothetical protein